MNHKETIKSIALGCLICSAVFLSGRSWVYGELMPSENFTMRGMMSFLKTGVAGGFVPYKENWYQAEEDEGNLFLPSSISILVGGERKTIIGNTKQLYTGHTILKEELQSAFAGALPKIKKAESQEVWSKVLGEDGALLDFKTTLTFFSYLEYLGIDTVKLDEGDNFSFRYLLIKEEKNPTLYFKSRQGVVHMMGLASMSTMAQTIAGSLELQQGKTRYALATQQQRTQGFLVEEQLVPLDMVFTTVLKQKNPMEVANEAELEGISQNILKAFAYNPSTITKYKNNDNSMVYVENFSTLKISTTGLVVYKASEVNKGISLLDNQNSQDGKLSEYELIAGVHSFFGKFDKNLLGGSGALISYKGVNYNENNRSYDLYFGYECNGIEIYHPNFTENMGYPIRVVVQDGYITGVTLEMKRYTNSEIAMPNLKFEGALQAFQGEGQAQNNEIKLVYEDDSTTEIVTTVYVQEAME